MSEKRPTAEAVRARAAELGYRSLQRSRRMPGGWLRIDEPGRGFRTLAECSRFLERQEQRSA